MKAMEWETGTVGQPETAETIGSMERGEELRIETETAEFVVVRRGPGYWTIEYDDGDISERFRTVLGVVREVASALGAYLVD